MHPKVEQKVGEWLVETFSQVGEFCEVTLVVDIETLVYTESDWPLDDIEKHEMLGAAQRNRDGEADQTTGIAFDRNLAIYLACNLMMLLPAATNDRMKAEPGPLDEDDLESLGEIGNLLTGILNQLAAAQAEQALQLEFLGIHSSGVNPAEDGYATGAHSFAVKVKADKHTFDITLYLTDVVLQNWCEEIFLLPIGDEDEEEGSDEAKGEKGAEGHAVGAGPEAGQAHHPGGGPSGMHPGGPSPMHPGGPSAMGPSGGPSTMGPTGGPSGMGPGGVPHQGYQSGPQSTGNYTPQVPQDFSSTKVPNSHPWLIADGSAKDLAHMRELLGQASITMLPASSASDTIENLKNNWAEGLFVDVELSDDDGINLLKRLRANFLTSDIPVIITASEPTRDQVMNAIRAGATHFLVKPLTDESIKAAFSQALRRHPRLRARVKPEETDPQAA